MEPHLKSSINIITKSLSNIRNDSDFSHEQRQIKVNMIGNVFFLAKSEKCPEFNAELLKVFKNWLDNPN